MTIPETLSIREAASATGLTLQRIYILIWEGKLKAMKVGRVWRIPLSEIESRGGK